MKLCASIILCIGSVCGQNARASEGLQYLAAFMCDPITVTEAIAADCAVSVDGLAGPIGDALAQWKRRNGVAAEALRQNCAAVIQESGKTAEQRAEWQASIATLNGATIASRVKLPPDQKAKQCAEVLRDLKSTALDLERLL
jgi:hypothetical protein